VRALLAERLGLTLSIVDLFRHPTIESLAGLAAKTERALPEPAAPVADGEIAIIGMAGRFPGAQNVEEFWRNLRDGAESIARLSREELLASGISPEVYEDPSYVAAKACSRVSSFSMLRSLASVRVKRRSWTRSIACFSNARGRRWRMQDTPRAATTVRSAFSRDAGSIHIC
jgi:hypothetical protein